MLIGGLWHGANWTFVVWGGLHGLFLMVNHAWRAVRGERQPTVVGRWAGRLVTFVVVVLAWVFFRADSFNAARLMFEGMAGDHGWMAATPAQPSDWFSELLKYAGVNLVAGWPAVGLVELIWCVGMLIIVWALPNTQQFLLGEGRMEQARLAWKPTPAWAAAIGISCGMAFTYVVIAENRVSEFIYFIF
jgi:hypothetical protein